MDTKKATAEPAHTFQEQSHGFKKPNRNLELDPWSHLFVAVSAHFSCLRSLSGTIEVTVISVVGGAPVPRHGVPWGLLCLETMHSHPGSVTGSLMQGGGFQLG